MVFPSFSFLFLLLRSIHRSPCVSSGSVRSACVCRWRVCVDHAVIFICCCFGWPLVTRSLVVLVSVLCVCVQSSSVVAYAVAVAACGGIACVRVGLSGQVCGSRTSTRLVSCMTTVRRWTCEHYTGFSVLYIFSVFVFGQLQREIRCTTEQHYIIHIIRSNTNDRINRSVFKWSEFKMQFFFFLILAKWMSALHLQFVTSIG